jgi:hypothetical protein
MLELMDEIDEIIRSCFLIPRRKLGEGTGSGLIPRAAQLQQSSSGVSMPLYTEIGAKPKITSETLQKTTSSEYTMEWEEESKTIQPTESDAARTGTATELGTLYSLPIDQETPKMTPEPYPPTLDSQIPEEIEIASNLTPSKISLSDKAHARKSNSPVSKTLNNTNGATRKFASKRKRVKRMQAIEKTLAPASSPSKDESESASAVKFSQEQQPADDLRTPMPAESCTETEPVIPVIVDKPETPPHLTYVTVTGVTKATG